MEAMGKGRFTWGRGMRRKRVEKPMVKVMIVCTTLSIRCIYGLWDCFYCAHDVKEGGLGWAKHPRLAIFGGRVRRSA